MSPSEPTPSPQPVWRDQILPVTLFGLALAVSLIVRIRLLDAPLERDEGEHGYLAQAMLAGHAPWEIAYNLKLPGTDFAYALFLWLFGQTAAAIRIGLLLVSSATAFLIALLGKRLFGVAAGALAGASFAILACSQSVVGTIAHSVYFVVFFAVIGTLLLLRPYDRRDRLALSRIFLAGLAYGLAFLMKQPGAAFAVFGVVFVGWQVSETRTSFRQTLKALSTLLSGVALPYLLLCLWLWRAGTFDRFWYWTVTLATAFASQRSFTTQVSYFRRMFPLTVGPNLCLWILAAAGLASSFFYPATRRAGLLVLMLLAFSFLAVSAGGGFNPNYFVLAFPAVALGVGAFGAVAEQVAQRSPRLRSATAIAAVCVTLACLWSVVLQRGYLFAMTPLEFSRNTYGYNPFPEAVQVGNYIRTHSASNARVAVLGSEAEIYFYSRRRAATGYLFTYGLMESHPYARAGQGEMIREILESKPEYLIYVQILTSWLRTPASSKDIFTWTSEYARDYYTCVGVVDLIPGHPSIYVWGAPATNYLPTYANYLAVYRRN